MEGQSEEAIAAEAEAYFLRNRDIESAWASHALLAALHQVAARGTIKRVLEVGCFDGRRLGRLASEFGCEVVGVEASESAVARSRQEHPSVHVLHGIAPHVLEDSLSGERFDVVILGFFAYLLPRRYLFRLASAVDALVNVGGHIVVEDFYSPEPIRKRYEHARTLETYKMDNSSLWLWNPQYDLVYRAVTEHRHNAPWPEDQGTWTTVDVLLKSSIQSSYLLRT